MRKRYINLALAVKISVGVALKLLWLIEEKVFQSTIPVRIPLTHNCNKNIPSIKIDIRRRYVTAASFLCRPEKERNKELENADFCGARMCI